MEKKLRKWSGAWTKKKEWVVHVDLIFFALSLSRADKMSLHFYAKTMILPSLCFERNKKKI